MEWVSRPTVVMSIGFHPPYRPKAYQKPPSLGRSMHMACSLTSLAPDDLPELSRFLTVGFHAPADADFAAIDVLRWKYLETYDSTNDEVNSRDGSGAPNSYVARDEAGQIIGHLGLCRTAFEGQALAPQDGQVPTIHIIDWLGSPTTSAAWLTPRPNCVAGPS